MYITRDKSGTFSEFIEIWPNKPLKCDGRYYSTNNVLYTRVWMLEKNEFKALFPHCKLPRKGSCTEVDGLIKKAKAGEK